MSKRRRHKYKNSTHVMPVLLDLPSTFYFILFSSNWTFNLKNEIKLQHVFNEPLKCSHVEGLSDNMKIS